MKIVLPYAIEEEKIEIKIPSAELIYVATGMGKVRAAMRTMRAIYEHKPDMVINFGTAGTIKHQVGDVCVCNRFIDRDLQKVVLDGVVSEIQFPIEEILSKDILKANKSKKYTHIKSILQGGICNTGDSFITQGSDIDGDVVDMEAYGVADVCREMGIPFLSVKYITDVIGQNSWQDWYAKIADARKGLAEFFE
ncbi:MAG: 5'-methylthioadenosine/S-adenosylhomocysteine nucleosidase [Bacteroidales bacterium]|nr:5'-methylthioadenosine/S-adenosylhomocysteine nucleosidase [Bacteroidales bacterium]